MTITSLFGMASKVTGVKATGLRVTLLCFRPNILLFVCHPGLKTNLRLPAVPLCLCSPDKISLFIYPKPQKDPIRGLFQRHEIIEYFYALINFW